MINGYIMYRIFPFPVSKQFQGTMVFTNGCFDILHVGHFKFLTEAKSFGDILVVGLNSDESVKKIKGQRRPIFNLDDRIRFLFETRLVDYIYVFDEETPINIIRELRPNVLVKGSDYISKEIVGSDLVDRVKTVELAKGISTSYIISKVYESGLNL